MLAPIDVLVASAPLPTAVFCIPVVLAASAPLPTATLSVPVVLAFKAFVPKAVLFVAAPAFKAPTPKEVLVAPIIPAGELFLLKATSASLPIPVPIKCVPLTILVFPVIS